MLQELLARQRERAALEEQKEGATEADELSEQKEGATSDSDTVEDADVTVNGKYVDEVDDDEDECGGVPDCDKEQARARIETQRQQFEEVRTRVFWEFFMMQ